MTTTKKQHDKIKAAIEKFFRAQKRTKAIRWNNDIGLDKKLLRLFVLFFSFFLIYLFIYFFFFTWSEIKRKFRARSDLFNWAWR